MVILAVDDDSDDLQLFYEAVIDIDASITLIVARNGEEAINLLTKKDAILPDCIFLDINMPLMNGLQCLDKIRSIKYLKEINVVMFSTSITKRDIDFFTKRGAQYLTKALDYNTLQKALMKILGSLN